MSTLSPDPLVRVGELERDIAGLHAEILSLRQRIGRASAIRNWPHELHIACGGLHWWWEPPAGRTGWSVKLPMPEDVESEPLPIVALGDVTSDALHVQRSIFPMVAALVDEREALRLPDDTSTEVARLRAAILGLEAELAEARGDCMAATEQLLFGAPGADVLNASIRYATERMVLLMTAEARNRGH